MKRKLLSLVTALFASFGAFAQLPVGSVAPDFTLTDINGASQHLYSYLDSGYTVILDVSAAWCGPCWSAHQSHVFENLTDHYGKNGTISAGKVKVIFIEGEGTNTTAQLHGTSSGTAYATYSQGDWVAGTNYPFIDNTSQNANYLYGGFPSFTVICRDHLIANTQAGYGSTMGVESFWMNIINGGCPSYAPSTSVDAKAIPYAGTGAYICNANPTVKFQNYSTSSTLTSATIKLYSGSTVVATYPWTGSVAPYGIGTATIPSFAGAAFNSYKFEVTATGDSRPSNNTSRDSMFKVYSAGNAVATPWSENFETNVDLPYKMTSSAEELRAFSSSGSYILKGVDGNNSRAMMFGFPETSTSGTVIEVVLGNFNTASASNVTLGFDLAHANASGKTDKLEIKVSKDCGATWTTAWTKSGAALGTTASPASGAFVPTAGNQWRQESVLLTPYKGSNMVIKVVGTSNQGHYAFMDNLRITNTLDVANVIATGSVSVYPNPARESATLDFMLSKSGQVTVNVVDAVGRTVAVAANAVMQQGAQHISFSTGSLATGVYNITIQTEEGTLTQRLAVVK